MKDMLRKEIGGGIERGLRGVARAGRPIDVRVIRAIACLHLQLRQVHVIACIPTIAPSQYRTKVIKIDIRIAVFVILCTVAYKRTVHLYLGGGVVAGEIGFTFLITNYPVTI